MRLAFRATNSMNAVDTNVLIYAHDSRDPGKQSTAIFLLDSLTDLALLWQVACEYVAASRKLVPFGYDLTKAWEDVHDMRSSWTTILPAWTIQDLAEDLMVNYSLSFWDAMIIAACLEGGVTCLYSEDFDAYPKIEGLSLINPFKAP
jgi:predicted nucleic acid-binding protein